MVGALLLFLILYAMSPRTVGTSLTRPTAVAAAVYVCGWLADYALGFWASLIVQAVVAAGMLPFLMGLNPVQSGIVAVVYTAGAYLLSLINLA